MNNELTWEQKFAALNALAECSLRLRERGDWYVCQHIEIKQGGRLVCPAGGGSTPEEAVENHWQRYVTDLKPNEHLVTNASGHRIAARWNGFMWRLANEPPPPVYDIPPPPHRHKE